jgi:small-conductance mechanosensitive channel
MGFIVRPPCAALTISRRPRYRGSRPKTIYGRQGLVVENARRLRGTPEFHLTLTSFKRSLIVRNALNALGAILILLIGLLLSGRADLLVETMLRRTPQIDPMLQSFFGSLARYLVLTVTVLAVMSEFGIQTASLVAIIGAASLAVGLALQGTLSNLAAGVTLARANPRVLADPAPSVLLDRIAGENALEVVVAFSTEDDVAALVKSDLIKAVHAMLDANPSKQLAHSV